MTPRNAAHRKTVSVAEVIDWPPLVRAWPDAGTACQLSRTTTFELIARNEFPVPVIRLGRSLRCRRSDLLDFLGIHDSDGAGESCQATPDAAARVTSLNQL